MTRFRGIHDDVIEHSRFGVNSAPMDLEITRRGRSFIVVIAKWSRPPHRQLLYGFTMLVKVNEGGLACIIIIVILPCID